MSVLKFDRKSTHKSRKDWRCTFCGEVRPAGTNYEKRVFMTDDTDGPVTFQTCKGQEMADVCEYWRKFKACFADSPSSSVRGFYFYEDIRAKDAKEAIWRAEDHAQAAEAYFLTILPDGFEYRAETLRNEQPERWLEAAGMEFHACRPESSGIPYLFWFKTQAEADTFSMVWGGKTIMREAE